MPAAAHRLTLTAAEAAVLLRAYPFELPPGFGAPRAEPDSTADGAVTAPDDSALRQAAADLFGRGVLVSDDPGAPEAVPTVAANMAVLASPVLTVRVEVASQRAGSRAYFATAGPFGASLFVLAEGGYELSMFPAVSLGRELIRAVPEPHELATERARIRAALGGQADPPLRGELPLSALGEYDLARRLSGPDGADGAEAVAAALELTPEQAEVAERVRDLSIGVLWALAAGRHGDGVLVGQVVWLATDQGWVEARPDPDGSGRRMVALRPVAREELGVRLAPYVSEILRSTADAIFPAEAEDDSADAIFPAEAQDNDGGHDGRP